MRSDLLDFNIEGGIYMHQDKRREWLVHFIFHPLPMVFYLSSCSPIDFVPVNNSKKLGIGNLSTLGEYGILQCDWRSEYIGLNIHNPSVCLLRFPMVSFIIKYASSCNPFLSVCLVTQRVLMHITLKCGFLKYMINMYSKSYDFLPIPAQPMRRIYWGGGENLR